MKNSFKLLLPAVLLAAFLNACGTEPQPAARPETAPVETVETVKAAIAAGNQRLMDGVSKGDAAAIAAVYSSDAVILPSNSEAVSGTAAIQGMMQGMMGSGIKKMVLEIGEVQAMGDLAYEVGKYKMYVAGDQEADQGKYIVIWKNEGGAWKIYRDIFNSSNPAPVAAK